MDNKVAIREVTEGVGGDIDNLIEVAGVKKEYFDFESKSSLKVFVDNLGT